MHHDETQHLRAAEELSFQDDSSFSDERGSVDRIPAIRPV